MREPEIVRAATGQYSAEMDEIGTFIEEQCELGPDFTATATELYQAFSKATSNAQISQQSFGSRLRQKGYEKTRITSGINKAKHGWKGLRLRLDGESEHLHRG